MGHNPQRNQPDRVPEVILKLLSLLKFTDTLMSSPSIARSPPAKFSKNDKPHP